MYSTNDSLFEDENLSSAKLKHAKNYEKNDEDHLSELAEMESQAELIALQIAQQKLKIKIDSAKAVAT